MKGDRADKRSDGVLTCVQKFLEEGRERGSWHARDDQ